MLVLTNAPAINATVQDAVESAGGAGSGIRANAAQGAAFEAAIRDGVGASKAASITVAGMGRRILDGVIKTAQGGLVGLEMKSGSLSTVSQVSGQIAKDAQLIKNGELDAIVWIVKGDVSDKVRAALNTAKIKLVEMPKQNATR